eukprot:jgi/Chrzof1/33/Cz01g01030.t1
MHKGVVVVLTALLWAVTGTEQATEKSRQLPCITCRTPNRAQVVPLPYGTKPEGLTAGDDDDFWVASTEGYVLHVDGRSGRATKVVSTGRDAHPSGIVSGIKYDSQQKALFVTGTAVGKAYIYYLAYSNGTYTVNQTLEAELSTPGVSYINDIVLGDDTAYFTDSWQPYVYAIPRFARDTPMTLRKIYLGPTFVPTVLGIQTPGPAPQIRANGIALVDNKTLLVANWILGSLAKVDMSSSETVITEIALPSTKKLQPFSKHDRMFPDGLLLTGKNNDLLYLADNFNNRVVVLQFYEDYTRVRLSCIIDSKQYATPTTLALNRGYLWAVNAHFFDCPVVAPCTKQPYEIVGVDPSDYCS